MAQYSTREIADTLGVGIDSVRRWIKEGLLKATFLREKGFTSGKGQYVVQEEDLNTFLETKWKYHQMLSKMDRLGNNGISKSTLDSISDITRGLSEAENSLKTAKGYIDVCNRLLKDLIDELNNI